MTYCHISKQIALHADRAPVQTFGDLGEWEQELVVSELAEAVLSGNASLKWADYPHTVNLEFAMQSLLEEAEFIEELANSVLHTQSARTLLINQRQAETKGLIKHALDETGQPPIGFEFGEILMGKAA